MRIALVNSITFIPSRWQSFCAAGRSRENKPCHLFIYNRNQIIKNTVKVFWFFFHKPAVFKSFLKSETVRRVMFVYFDWMSFTCILRHWSLIGVSLLFKNNVSKLQHCRDHLQHAWQKQEEIKTLLSARQGKAVSEEPGFPKEWSTDGTITHRQSRHGRNSWCAWPPSSPGNSPCPAGPEWECYHLTGNGSC